MTTTPTSANDAADQSPPSAHTPPGGFACSPDPWLSENSDPLEGLEAGIAPPTSHAANQAPPPSDPTPGTSGNGHTTVSSNSSPPPGTAPDTEPGDDSAESADPADPASAGDQEPASQQQEEEEEKARQAKERQARRQAAAERRRRQVEEKRAAFRDACSELQPTEVTEAEAEAAVRRMTALLSDGDTAPDLAQLELFATLLAKSKRRTRLRGHVPKGFDTDQVWEKSGRPRTSAYARLDEHDLAKWPGWHLGTYLIPGNPSPAPKGSTDWEVTRWGHRDEEIGSMPAFFVEHDDLSLGVQALIDWMGKYGLVAPSITVWSGNKSGQRYWLLDQPTRHLWRWRFMQWRFIQLCRSDERIENFSRLMRAPGCVYIGRDGQPMSRSVIDHRRSTGEVFTLDQIEEMLVAAEATNDQRDPERGILDPLDAIPASRWLDSQVVPNIRRVLADHYSDLSERLGGQLDIDWTANYADLLDRFDAQARVAERVGHTTARFSKKAREQLETGSWNLRRLVAAFMAAIDDGKFGTLTDIEEALACVPQRPGAGTGTYGKYRNLLWGLKAALVAIGHEDPVGTAIRLMEQHSPDGWNIAQVATSGGDRISASTFWWTCIEHGYEPSCGWDELLGTAAAKVQEGLERADIDAIHARIRQLIDTGSSPAVLQEYINGASGSGISPYGLSRYAESYREEVARREHQADVAEELAAAVATPKQEIVLADHLPAAWVRLMTVPREGLRIPDAALAMILVVITTCLLPPTCRIRGASITEALVVWLLLVGTSGTAKSAVMEMLLLTPYRQVVKPWLREEHKRRIAEWRAALTQADEAKAKGEVPPPVPPKPRPIDILPTPGGTVEGLEANQANWGPIAPMLYWADELEAWIDNILNPKGGGANSAGFWNSSYSQGHRYAPLADETKVRIINEGKISVVGGAQPSVMRDAIAATGTGSGFWARPLMVTIPRLPRKLLDDHGDLIRLAALLGDFYRAMLDRSHDAAEAPPEPDDTGVDRVRPRPGFINRLGDFEFRLTKAAGARFREFFNSCEERRMTSRTEAQDALWAKAASTALRLSAGQQILFDYEGWVGRGAAFEEEGALPYCLVDYFDRPLGQQMTTELTKEQRAEELEAAGGHGQRVSWVGDRALELAIRLTLHGKGVSMETHRDAEDEDWAMAQQLLRTAHRRLVKQQGDGATGDAVGVTLRECSKAGWSNDKKRGFKRPTTSDLRPVAESLAAQGLIGFDDPTQRITWVKEGTVS